MIVLITNKATDADIKKAREEFGDYIKIVIDIKREMAAIGGKLHADAEKVLLKNGSKQEDIWGGGMKTATKEIDFQGVINIRPKQDNNSMEILNSEIRRKFLAIAIKMLT